MLCIVMKMEKAMSIPGPPPSGSRDFGSSSREPITFCLYCLEFVVAFCAQTGPVTLQVGVLLPV